jgi:hypothetical protein
VEHKGKGAFLKNYVETKYGKKAVDELIERTEPLSHLTESLHEKSDGSYLHLLDASDEFDFDNLNLKLER